MPSVVSRPNFRSARVDRTRGTGIALLLFASLASCWAERAEAAERRWIRLARGFEPTPLGTPDATWNLPLHWSESDDSTDVWLEYEIAPEHWTKAKARPSEWHVPLPEGADSFRNFEYQARDRVRGGGHDFAHTTRALAETARTLEGEDASHLYYTDGSLLAIRLPEGEAPPDDLIYGRSITRGRATEGEWRAVVGPYSGVGLSLWPGQHTRVETGFPANSVLRFRIAAQPLLARADSTVRFRVLLDGEPVFEEALALEDEPVLRDVDVFLGWEERGWARFEFAVDGDPANAVFFHPVIGPDEPGGYGERPWHDSRPDLVLFSADTFRADNLAAYGGDPDVAPRLNRLAEDSVRFLQARSTSVWTLPSHASMFLGLVPTQHGANGVLRSFAPGLETVAELLAEAGYRTCAVTDSGYVSRDYGFDEGFEWFAETKDRSLAETLERALQLVGRDDGRPLFLFVHSYRVHRPYSVGVEQDASAYAEVLERLGQNIPPDEPRSLWGEREHLSLKLRRFAGRYRELYLDGVRSFDAQVGDWFDALGGAGLDRSAYVLFTSDHGEEFYEHGAAEHKGPPHEEKVRIPMLLRGPGLEPRDVVHGVSLVDVTPTLTELAGARSPRGLAGRSLLDVTGERPLLSFHTQAGKLMAITTGDRKVYFRTGQGELSAKLAVAAYDLAADPTERHNLLPGRAAWLSEFVADAAPHWRILRRPVAVGRALEEDAARTADLEALGYVE